MCVYYRIKCYNEIWLARINFFIRLFINIRFCLRSFKTLDFEVDTLKNGINCMRTIFLDTIDLMNRRRIMIQRVDN